MIPKVGYWNSTTDAVFIESVSLNLRISILPISQQPKKSKIDVIKDKNGEIIYELILRAQLK